MANGDVLVNMYHVDENYVNENKCYELFLKVNMVQINDMIHEAFVMPMQSGSLIRLVDSVVDKYNNKRIISVNYIKASDIHLVQTPDENLHLVNDKPNAKLQELAKKEDSGVTFSKVLLGQIVPRDIDIKDNDDDDDNEEDENSNIEDNNFNINEDETEKDIVMLSNGIANRTDTAMSSPALEKPNRVHLGENREPVQEQQIPPTPPVRQPVQNLPQQIDSRSQLRQRLQNPNHQNQQNYQPRENFRNNGNRNENRNSQQATKKNNQQQKKPVFRPILAPTNLELANN